eukprot:c23536_g2_i1 orf=323-682(-)
MMTTVSCDILHASISPCPIWLWVCPGYDHDPPFQMDTRSKDQALNCDLNFCFTPYPPSRLQQQGLNVKISSKLKTSRPVLNLGSRTAWGSIRSKVKGATQQLCPAKCESTPLLNDLVLK